MVLKLANLSAGFVNLKISWVSVVFSVPLIIEGNAAPVLCNKFGYWFRSFKPNSATTGWNDFNAALIKHKNVFDNWLNKGAPRVHAAVWVAQKLLDLVNFSNCAALFSVVGNNVPLGAANLLAAKVDCSANPWVAAGPLAELEYASASHLNAAYATGVWPNVIVRNNG